MRGPHVQYNMFTYNIFLMTQHFQNYMNYNMYKYVDVKEVS